MRAACFAIPRAGRQSLVGSSTRNRLRRSLTSSTLVIVTVSLCSSCRMFRGSWSALKRNTRASFAGARFVEAMATATVPKIVLTLNHASGAGYYAMAGQGFDPDFIFSWPTGRMGVMEGESAVQAVFGSQLQELSARGEEPGENVKAEME